MSIEALFNALPGAVSQGLIWGIMAIGVYITFKIMDIADLTVDGTLCTGAAVCVVALVGGLPMWLAILLALIAGMLAGLVTGLFHTAFGIPAILAGILTQLALYSINLRIMGWGTENGSRSNLPISVDKYDLMVSSRYVRELSLDNPLPKLIIFLAVIIWCSTGSSARRPAAPSGPPAPMKTWPRPRASTPALPKCWA